MMAGKTSIGSALLIYPPTGVYDRFERCQSPVESESVNIVRPPSDLAYLAAVLEKHGIKTYIRDYPASGKGWRDVEGDVKSLTPDLLLVSATLFTCRQDCRAFKIAKGYKHGVFCVLKGFFPDAGRRILEETEEIDLILREEPEACLDDLMSGMAARNIPGITYREGKGIFVTPVRQAIADLDSLPFPARHLCDNGLYRMPDNGRKMGVVLAGKGCPRECVFCLVPAVNGKRVRLRSHVSLMAELRECVYKYGINDFWFRADNFTADREWVLGLCSGISRSGLPVRWAVNSRADSLDRELGTAMKKAGCFAVGLGVESGSEETLLTIKKNITKDRVRDSVKICRECGLQTYLFFIIGFPWETRGHIEETIRFACELRGDAVNFSFPAPFHGTALFEIYKTMGFLKDPDLYAVNNYGLPGGGTLYLSADELVKIEKKAYRRLFFAPGYIFRRLSGIGSLREGLFIFKAACHLFKLAV